MDVEKTHLDDYMVKCFRVRDIKLIFLWGCHKNHFEKANNANPKESLNFNNTTICKTSTSVSAGVERLSYISLKFLCEIPTHWDWKIVEKRLENNKMVSRIKELKTGTEKKGLGGWARYVVQNRVDQVSSYQLRKNIRKRKDNDNLKEDGKHIRIMGKKVHSQK